MAPIDPVCINRKELQLFTTLPRGRQSIFLSWGGEREGGGGA